MLPLPDKIFTMLALLIFLLALFTYLGVSFTISLPSVILLCLFFLFLIKSRKSQKKELPKFMSYREYYLTLLLEGFELLTTPLNRILFSSQGTVRDNYLFFDTRLYYFAIKTTNASADDLIKAYKLARKMGMSEIILVHCGINRNAIAYLANTDIKMEVKHLIQLYRLLKRKGGIPFATQKKGHRLASLHNVVFNIKNVKLYIYSAIMTGLMSLIVPLKLYYLIFASINIIMAVLTIFVCYRKRKLL